jgi:hypothetical protein
MKVGGFKNCLKLRYRFPKRRPRDPRPETAHSKNEHHTRDFNKNQKIRQNFPKNFKNNLPSGLFLWCKFLNH